MAVFLQTALLLLLFFIAIKVRKYDDNVDSFPPPCNRLYYRSCGAIDIPARHAAAVQIQLTNGRPKHAQPCQCKPTNSIQLLFIILGGDISTNPGPVARYPCGVCKYAVTNKCQAIQCDHCDTWIHNKCSAIKKMIDMRLISHPSI